MKKTITLLFIFFCLLNAQIYAEISGYLYYKNKAGGNTARVMHDGKWWYKYDANGNRTIKAAAAQHEGNTVTINTTTEYWEYEWDYHNRLIKVQQFNAPDNASNVCVEYTYDALNRRIERISRTNTKPVVTHYAYGRNGTLTYQKKIVGEELTERTYVYLNNQIVAFVDKTPDGTEKTYYTVTDIQGTVTEVYDEEFKLVWKSDYAAFGIKAGETIDLIDFDGLYTGCDFDAETGLSYHWNRWRSEDGNSWLSQDPARDGLNWYGYAGQNPINFVDPNGEIQYPILSLHKMQEADSNTKLTGSNLLLNSKGCAVAAISNMLNLSLEFVNDTYVENGNLNWQKVADDYGWKLSSENNNSFTKAQYAKQDNNRKGDFYTIINVNYTVKGKNGDHWVGLQKVVTEDGIDYAVIAASSIHDSSITAGTVADRKGRGWKVDKDGNIMVPLNQTKGYRTYYKGDIDDEKEDSPTSTHPSSTSQNPEIKYDGSRSGEKPRTEKKH